MENIRPRFNSTSGGTRENALGFQPRRGEIFVARQSDRFLSSVGGAWSPRCRPDGAFHSVWFIRFYKDSTPTELETEARTNLHNAFNPCRP